MGAVVFHFHITLLKNVSNSCHVASSSLLHQLLGDCSRESVISSHSKLFFLSFSHSFSCFAPFSK